MENEEEVEDEMLEEGDTSDLNLEYIERRGKAEGLRGGEGSSDVIAGGLGVRLKNQPGRTFLSE